MYEGYFKKYVNMGVTEDIKKFVNEEIFGTKEYVFVKKENGILKGFCTKCFKEFDLEYAKHNAASVCPSCGAPVTAKLTRYGRGNCENKACFYYFEKSPAPDVVICKGYYVSRKYDDYKNPCTEYDLCAIYIFKAKESVMISPNYGSWEMKKSIFDFNLGWLANVRCHCSFDSIGKAIKGTCFEHIPYKPFKGYYSMTKLFDEYSKHPGIEYLVKEGFVDLVKCKLNGDRTYSTVNWNGKNIFKILKINKVDLREIKSQNINVSFLFLKVFHDCKNRKWNLTVEEIVKLVSNFYFEYEELIKLTEYSSMKKIFNYFFKQLTKYNKNYYSNGAVLRTFKDYIADCKKLQMDLSKEQILFPKDLYKAHQHTTKQIKIKANKKYDAMIKERAKSLEKYIFQDENYLIRPALSSLDLIEEGSQLNHCVATHYTIPYAEGKTNILLVRKIAEPDKPYCTVEVKDNEVKQAYIKNDKIPPRDTLDFIDKFKKAKLIGRNKKARLTA